MKCAVRDRANPQTLYTLTCDGSGISANPGGIIGSVLAYILLLLVVWSSGRLVPEALARMMRVPGGERDGQGWGCGSGGRYRGVQLDCFSQVNPRSHRAASREDSPTGPSGRYALTLCQRIKSISDSMYLERKRKERNIKPTVTTGNCTTLSWHGKVN